MKVKDVLSRIRKPATFVVGLPLMCIGVLLLALHYLLHSTSNSLLVVALLLEIIGISAHYWKIKHQKQ